MSSVNIKRVVKNIQSNTTIYIPIVEMIINGIQAIADANRKDGTILVRVKRGTHELDSGLSGIIGFDIEDNGIGFTGAHRNFFDTLYTDLRSAEGCKGFGRFTSLKYFENLHVTSIYQDGVDFKCRSFSIGTKNEIIVNERVDATSRTDTGSTDTLNCFKGERFDKRLLSLARNLAQAGPYLTLSSKIIFAQALFFVSKMVVIQFD
jgi:hypothetical protein